MRSLGSSILLVVVGSFLPRVVGAVSGYGDGLSAR